MDGLKVIALKETHWFHLGSYSLTSLKLWLNMVYFGMINLEWAAPNTLIILVSLCFFLCLLSGASEVGEWSLRLGNWTFPGRSQSTRSLSSIAVLGPHLMFPSFSCFLFLFYPNTSFCRKQKGEKAKQEAKLKKMNSLLDSNMKKRMQLSEDYNHLVWYHYYYHLSASRSSYCVNS